MNFKKQRIATAALAISFLGAGATCFSGGFLGAMLHHGFVASLIGGLADWFAVVALFRKPLGISYRTEVLKRNRKRIMDEIVNFVTKDILSAKNIMRVLDKENMAALFTDYLKERGGKSRIMAAVEEVLTAWLQSVDTKKTASKFIPAFYDGLFTLLEKDRLEILFEVAVKHDREVLSALADFSESLIKLSAAQDALKARLKEGIEEYSGDSFGRNALVEFLDLNENTLLEKINVAVLKKLDSVKQGEGENYLNLKTGFENYVENFLNDDNLPEKTIAVKKYLKERIFTEEKVCAFMEKSINGAALKESVKEFVSLKLEEFENNEDFKQKFDAWLKNFIAEEIEKRQDAVERLVRERLDELSDEKFSDFVENKVADDLQMIRVNGGIVGGAVGMALYVITYAAERMF